MELKILIVEDVAETADRIQFTLTSKGYNVIGIAGNSKEAYELADKYRPNIIIMDIKLSDDENAETGVDVAVEIQKNMSVFIIYLTSIGLTDSALQKVTQTKPSVFLRKPLDEDELLINIEMAQSQIKQFELSKFDSNLIFISYSHKGFKNSSANKYIDEMIPYLEPLKKSGIGTDIWSDNRIPPGANWTKEIEKALSSAKVAILFINIHFINSTFISDIELPTLLQHRDNNDILVIPVFVNEVSSRVLNSHMEDIVSGGVGGIMGMNNPDKPLSTIPLNKRISFWNKLQEIIYTKLNVN